MRIALREGGVRLYAVRPEQPAAASPATAVDALIDVIVATYALLPLASLGQQLSHLRGGAPQWAGERAAALASTEQRLPQATVERVTRLWPDGDHPASSRHAQRTQTDTVRLLAPFDPIVWNRRRFKLLCGWACRFEAYTPAPKRIRGYHVLPLLWRDQVIGWGNLAVRDGRLVPDLGYVEGRAPARSALGQALDDELQRVSRLLALV